MWISPKYQDTDFHQPLSIDDKITIFEDRTIGWKIDIADQVINGRIEPNGSYEREPIPGSGFATLDIIFSYFEMIAKYGSGFAQTGSSKKYFKQGVYSVFPVLHQARIQANIPSIQGDVSSLADYTLGLLYEGIRCGLYHSGITNGRVVLTGEIQEPIAIELQTMVLYVNPHLLVPELKRHFSVYVGCLRDPIQKNLRNNFEARFDFDSRD